MQDRVTGGAYIQTGKGESVIHPRSTVSKLKVMDSALPCQASLQDSRKFLNMLENGHWRFVPSARNERFGGNVFIRPMLVGASETGILCTDASRLFWSCVSYSRTPMVTSFPHPRGSGQTSFLKLACEF